MNIIKTIKIGLVVHECTVTVDRTVILSIIA